MGRSYKTVKIPDTLIATRTMYLVSISGLLVITADDLARHDCPI